MSESTPVSSVTPCLGDWVVEGTWLINLLVLPFFLVVMDGKSIEFKKKSTLFPTVISLNDL